MQRRRAVLALRRVLRGLLLGSDQFFSNMFRSSTFLSITLRSTLRSSTLRSSTLRSSTLRSSTLLRSDALGGRFCLVRGGWALFAHVFYSPSLPADAPGLPGQAVKIVARRDPAPAPDIRSMARPQSSDSP